MVYHKAKITNVKNKESEKVGQFISMQFTYESEEGSKKAFKNFFINHPKKEVQDKSRQMLYKMRQYKGNPQEVDNSILLDSDVMISLTQSEEFINVNTVYFLA